MYNNDNQNIFGDGDEFESRHRNPLLFYLFMGLSIIFFLPALIVGFINYYLLFLKAKQHLSVITPIVILEIMISSLFAFKQNFGFVIKQLFLGNFTMFLSSYLTWCVLIGFIGSYIFICLRNIQFKFNPSVLAMDTRLHNFTFNSTPWALFKKQFLTKELENGKAYSSDAAPVGLLEEPPAVRKKEIDDNKVGLIKYDPEIVYRSYQDAVKQTIITGQTGSGKSMAMLSLMYNDIINQVPLCVVDFKKSGDVLYFLSKWAKENNREFFYFTNGEGQKNKFYGEQATYDPLSTGDQTSRADFILNLREWDSSADVYKQRTQEILQGILYALISVPHEKAPGIDWEAGNLKQLISALDLKNMYDLVNYLSIEMKNNNLDMTNQLRVSNFMANYNEMADPKSSEGKALREQLMGIKTVCNKLVMSSYGKWLMEGSSKKHIDLLKIASDKNAPICLFSFSAQEEPDFAKSMGQVIMSDLNRVSAAKTGMTNKDKFGVYIDEFQILNPKFIADLLAKARSAGFFITIASQSLEQISASATENPDAILQAILDVCGNYLFLKGAKQDSAERMAKIMGQTKHIIRHVSSRTNNGFLSFSLFSARHGLTQNSTQDDWVVSPAAFQDLKDARETNGKYSEAYFISTFEDAKGHKTNAAQKVRIIAKRDLIEGPSEEFTDFIRAQTYHYLESGKNPTNRIVEVKKSTNDDLFSSIKTAHKINKPNNMTDVEIDKEIDSEFEKIPDEEQKPEKVDNDKIDEDVEMTTFEKIQRQKNNKNFDKNYSGRYEPELLSRNIEKNNTDDTKKVDNNNKNKKFTLPKL
jgi:hypothetical protein